jgi:glycerol-3-phosphate acyltransferase PlsY
MKTTKSWLYLSMVFLLPVFISTIMIAMICAEWLLTDQSRLGLMILKTGTFNKPLATTLFGLGAFGVSVIFCTIMMLMRHAKNIDRLEDAIHNYYVARQKYERATHKVVQQTEL